MFEERRSGDARPPPPAARGPATGRTALTGCQCAPDRFAGLGFAWGDGWRGADLIQALGTYAERSPSDTG